MYSNAKIKSEEALSKPCIDWLEELGAEVSAEVKALDIMGVIKSASSENIIIGIELKLSLNLEVILQSVERQKVCDFVYIAIPHSNKQLEGRRFKRISLLLRRLSIGLLTVDFRKQNPVVSVIMKPKPYDFEKSLRHARKKKNELLTEFDKRITAFNSGGVNKKKIITSYREQALYIAYLLGQNGEMSIKKLLELGADKKKTSSILQKNYYGWYQRIKKGSYALTELGENAIVEYDYVLKALVECVNE